MKSIDEALVKAREESGWFIETTIRNGATVIHTDRKVLTESEARQMAATLFASTPIKEIRVAIEKGLKMTEDFVVSGNFNNSRVIVSIGKISHE